MTPTSADVAAAFAGRIVLTLAEIAEVTPWTMWFLRTGCRTGRLPHVRCGKSYGMTREQVEQVIAAHTVEPDSDTAVADIADLEATRRYAASRTGRGRSRRRPA